MKLKWFILILGLSICLFSCQQTPDKANSSLGDDPSDTDFDSQVMNAEGYNWLDLKVGAGGFITSLEISPDGLTRIAQTDTYGLYRWSPKANKWFQLITENRLDPHDVKPSLSEGVYAVAAAPSNSRRIYMAFNNKFYVSNNRGSTWTRSSLPNTYRNPNDAWRIWGGKLSVDPSNSNVVIIGSSDQGKTYISTDGAKTFREVTGLPGGRLEPHGGPNISAIVFDPSSPIIKGRSTVVYASSYKNGVYRSTNGGDSWTRIPGGPSYLKRAEISSDGTLYGVDSKDVWRFKKSWQKLTPNDLDWSDLADIAIDPSNPQRLVLSQDSGRLFQSNNGGQSWTYLPYSISGKNDVPWIAWTDYGWLSIGQVKFDPLVKNRVFAATGTGVIYADLAPNANQINWQLESRGIEQLVGNDVISPPGGKPVVAAWDFGTFYITNPTTYRDFRAVSKRFNSTWQLDYLASNPKFMVGNTSDHRFCCAEDGLAIQAGYSEDGGQSWIRFPTIPRLPGNYEDGSSKAENPFAFGFGSIAVSSNNPNNIVWAPTANEVPYYSLDRGKTWQAVNLPGLDPKLPLGSHYALYLNRKNLASDKTRANTFYYVHSGQWDEANQINKNAGVFKSTDGARTWQRVYSGEIASFSVFNASLKSVPGYASHLFFTSGALEGNPGSNFMRSSNGGVSWQTIPDVKDVHAFGFGKAAPGGTYPSIYIAGFVKGKYGIYRSTDNGKSWRPLGAYPQGKMDQITAIDGDKDRFGRVYLAFSGSGFAFGFDPTEK